MTPEEQQHLSQLVVKVIRLEALNNELLAALKVALPFVSAIYREHGRDYLPNSGDAQERISTLIANAERKEQ